MCRLNQEGIMHTLFSDQARLLVLLVCCAVLWSAESVMPLYLYPTRRLRRALPNIALAVLLVLTNLALSFATASVAGAVNRRLGLFFLFSMPAWLMALSGMMALDLFTYLAHVLLHKSWLGWQFHRVHHTDNEVNVTTAFRQHPGETLWRIFWQVLAVGLFGIPLWVVIVYLLVSTLNAQLEHANIRLSEPVDRVLRLLFVTPHMHKVHHSREQQQTDTNYSNIFSVWDRIFGTYTSTVDFNRLRYGLDGFDERKRQTLPALLKLPFSVKAS
jgi:sterol desaturase/sphingolipid hydroxylase (fatty acid hydroxylase superfamily)